MKKLASASHVPSLVISVPKEGEKSKARIQVLFFFCFFTNVK